MKTSEINWNVVEEITKSVFPDEYEMLTPDQIKDLEDGISEGRPVTPDVDTGGVNGDFVDPMLLVSTILQVVKMLQEWYIYKHPNNQKADYTDFSDYQKDHQEILQNHDDEIVKRVSRVIEREFETITCKLDELRDILKTQKHVENNQ